jgi:hypothetical protein
MNDNERFFELMRNVMFSKHYAVQVDGVASKVYEHKPTGTLNIGIGEPVCKDLAVKSLHDFSFGSTYIGCYDKNGEEHIIELIKYVDINELLG